MQDAIATEPEFHRHNLETHRLVNNKFGRIGLKIIRWNTDQLNSGKAYLFQRLHYNSTYRQFSGLDSQISLSFRFKVVFKLLEVHHICLGRFSQ